jgi:hypothetical protein
MNMQQKTEAKFRKHLAKKREHVLKKIIGPTMSSHLTSCRGAIESNLSDKLVEQYVIDFTNGIHISIITNPIYVQSGFFGEFEVLVQYPIDEIEDDIFRCDYTNLKEFLEDKLFWTQYQWKLEQERKREGDE